MNNSSVSKVISHCQICARLLHSVYLWKEVNPPLCEMPIDLKATRFVSATASRDCATSSNSHDSLPFPAASRRPPLFSPS